MSKKHKRLISAGSVTAPGSYGLNHESEYKIIKQDLFKVLLLNLFYSAVVVAVYYANRSSGFLDRWFAKILHF